MIWTLWVSNLHKNIFSNMNDAYEWEKAKKYCETMDSHKTDTGARGRLWYPHSEEEQKRVGRWLVGKVKSPWDFNEKVTF